eukprot:gene14635-16154_t
MQLKLVHLILQQVLMALGKSLGHASINGVVSAISNSSGKVLDFQVRSKKCKACDRKNHLNNESLVYLQWQICHKARCTLNHKGSSGAMELEGLRDIFNRSETKYGVRYTKFIGEGDSSSYSTICEENPMDQMFQLKRRNVWAMRKNA